MIPSRFLTRAKARKIDPACMVALNGPSYRVDVCEVKLRLGPFVMNKVDVIASKQGVEAIYRDPKRISQHG